MSERPPARAPDFDELSRVAALSAGFFELGARLGVKDRYYKQEAS